MGIFGIILQNKILRAIARMVLKRILLEFSRLIFSVNKKFRETTNLTYKGSEKYT